MSIDSPWEIVAIIWAVVSLWIGGIGLLIAEIETYSHNYAKPKFGGWRRILVNFLLIVSGIVALTWTFDRTHVVEQTAQAVLALAIMVIVVVLLFMILRGRQGKTYMDAWWPRVRLPARIGLAAAALIGAAVETEAIARAALLLFASTQLFLIFWEVWLRWHFRGR